MARRTGTALKAAAVGGAVFGALGVAVLVLRRKPPPAAQRVALIGDSYAVGLGPELAKLLPDFKYEGKVGIGSAGWLNCSACGAWLPAFAPNVVLVSLGVNDGSAPNAANYQTIVRALHGIGARVVWIEPPAAVSAPAARAVIASLGVQTVPTPSVPMAADGLHPASYRPWAETIARTIA